MQAYYIACHYIIIREFSTESGKQSCQKGDFIEHTGLLLCKVALSKYDIHIEMF
jgi:hypothetical protein